MSLIASLQEGSAFSRRCLTRLAHGCLAWLGARRASWWIRWRCWLVDRRQSSTLEIYRQLGDDAMPPFGVVLGKRVFETAEARRNHRGKGSEVGVATSRISPQQAAAWAASVTTPSTRR